MAILMGVAPQVPISDSHDPSLGTWGVVANTSFPKALMSLPSGALVGLCWVDGPSSPGRVAAVQA